MKLFPDVRKSWHFILFRWCTIFLVISLGVIYLINMPGKSYDAEFVSLSNDEMIIRNNLHEHISYLSNDIGVRFSKEELELSVEYITNTLNVLGYEVKYQEYEAYDKKVRNIEIEKIGRTYPQEVLIIGAHYDTIDGTPGANDNASGVASLLEIARLFSGVEFERTVKLVFFVNEEPPYFQTDLMGSRVYAVRSRKLNENIVGMLSLETMGYYTDKADSQKYPFPLNYFYPDKGNFVAFVSNISSRKLLRKSIRYFRESTQFPSEGISAPNIVTGVDWSDHWSFWQEGYPAIMITDTALFRYNYYHTEEDTVDKLNLDSLSRIVLGISKVVQRLSDNQIE